MDVVINVVVSTGWGIGVRNQYAMWIGFFKAPLTSLKRMCTVFWALVVHRTKTPSQSVYLLPDPIFTLSPMLKVELKLIGYTGSCLRFQQAIFVNLVGKECEQTISNRNVWWRTSFNRTNKQSKIQVNCQNNQLSHKWSFYERWTGIPTVGHTILFVVSVWVPEIISGRIPILSAGGSPNTPDTLLGTRKIAFFDKW